MKPTEKTKKNSSKVSSRLSLGEHVPKLRFPGFEGEWERTSLGEKCKIIMGQSPDSASYNTIGVGIPLVQGNADIKNRVSCPNRHTSKPTKICRPNSVLLSVRAPVGTVGIANQTLCLGRGVCAIESDNNAFLYQFLIFKEDSWRNIEQGGTFTAINGDDIKKFTFIMPCEIEREKIATFLSLIDSRIAAQRKLVELLKKHKRGVIEQIFRQHLGLGKNSEKWNVVELRNLFSKVVRRNKDGRVKNVITNSAEFGLIPQRDFFDKSIAVEGNTDGYYIIHTGDFVYNPRKSTAAPFGPFNRYTGTEDGIISPLYTCLVPNEKADPEYLAWYFEAQLGIVTYMTTVHKAPDMTVLI